MQNTYIQTSQFTHCAPVPGRYRDAVELAEYTINNQKDYILEELYKRKPDVLCFSMLYMEY